MPHPNRPRPSQLHHHQTHGAEMALNLTRRAPGKDSLRLRRKVAAWDEDYLASLTADRTVRPIALPARAPAIDRTLGSPAPATRESDGDAQNTRIAPCMNVQCPATVTAAQIMP